jgi:hypothetical protein
MHACTEQQQQQQRYVHHGLAVIIAARRYETISGQNNHRMQKILPFFWSENAGAGLFTCRDDGVLMPRRQQRSQWS